MSLSLDTIEKGVAWDCDPFIIPLVQPVNSDLDIEDDEGDWQVIALDRCTRISTSRYGRGYRMDYR